MLIFLVEVTYIYANRFNLVPSYPHDNVSIMKKDTEHVIRYLWDHCDQRIFISAGAAYIRQWIRSALDQIMACRLLGTKPLSKPVQGYFQLDP